MLQVTGVSVDVELFRDRILDGAPIGILLEVAIEFKLAEKEDGIILTIQDNGGDPYWVVNGIDVNDATGAYRPPDAAERGRFLDALRSRGIAFVRRYSGGPDIHAACGMLASTSRGGKPA
jgi:hypothetical protein